MRILGFRAGRGAREIVRVVDLPEGRRPFRVSIDPARDVTEEVFRIGDRIRREFYRRVGYDDLLTPVTEAPEGV